MTRVLAALAVLLGLGAVYFIFTGMTRVVPPTDLPETAESSTTVETKTIQEERVAYTIDAEYPQFGISAVDTNIKEKIELSIEQFKKDVAAGPPPPGAAVQQYEFTSFVDSSYADSDIVSARVLVSTYMGGAHAMPVVHGLNFDRKTGKEIAPADAFRMTGLSLEEISAKAKAELQATLGSGIIAPEGADPTVDNYSTFTIDADSVTFIFQVYQVAPYAAGVQEISFERIR